MNDIIIIGGGPAGLAAAINAGAEGLKVMLLEGTHRVGGRAEPSHAIENYLGFLSVSGRQLAEIAHHQLEKFGVPVVRGCACMKLAFDDTSGNRLLQLSDGRTFRASNIVIATGMVHKELDLPGAKLWGVFYQAEPTEVEQWRAQTVWIIGGENSASQAALNFADNGANVCMLTGESGDMKMSAYLWPRLKTHPHITLMTGTLAQIHGKDGRVAGVSVGSRRFLADAVVLFGGAKPDTGWLTDTGIGLDPKGFIVTDPTTFCTARTGVYAVGDVRAGSVKRIGAAVGEGTSVIRHIMVASR